VYRVVKGLLFAWVVYLACSVLIVLPALNILPHRFLQDHYGRQLGTELILFNPFTLAVEVREATLSEPEGGPFLAFSHAEVNLSLASLAGRGLVLDGVALDGLDLHLRRQAGGALNIADFLPQNSDSEPAEKDTALPGITIGELSLDATRIAVTDHLHPDTYSTHLDGFSFAITDLSTVKPGGQPYQLRAGTEGGGELRWEGELSIPAGQSSGHLQLKHIDLRPALRFAGPWVAFELHSGQLDLGLDYTVDWSEALRYTVAGGALTLSDITLAPEQVAQLPDTGITLQTLQVTGVAVDSTPQTVTLDRLGINGLTVEGWSEGNRVSLTDMLLPVAAEQAPGTTPQAPAEPTEMGWTLRLKLAALQQGELRWRSEFTDPALLRFTPVTAELRNLHWPATAPSALTLSLKVNDAARVDLAGALHAGDGSGDIAFALEALPLAWFAPNLPDVLQARISSGEARTSGTVQLLNFFPESITADGAVSDFSMRLRGAENALTRWDSVSWTGLAVQPEARSVNLAELHIEGYEGQLHIEEDGQINLQRLLAENAANSAEAPDGDAPQDGGEAVAAAEPEAAWTADLPAIFVANSTLDFLDESLPIRFRAVIGDLDGTLSNLSTRPGQALTVDLKGSVDGYAPVTLEGTARPLQSPPALDLALHFRGLDMSRLTPYSGTYAGYAIEDGVMTADLQYGLEDDRLQGNNQIVIKQLQLGERVDSSKAMDLPLRLGIALLTDSNGVIDIAVPVSGDVNNPQFSLGSVIAGAFVNLLTKAVTAPFALLANLVGSSEDLDTVDYAAGSSALDTHGEGKLRDLAAAMQQRPELHLQISGRLELDSDRTQLQRQLFDAALLEAGLAVEDIRDRTRAWEDTIRDLYGGLALPPPNGETADAPSVLQQARIVRDQWPVPDAALVQLAQQRAATTRDFLLQTGVDALRLEIVPAENSDTAEPFSGVELAITVD
tara:strand:+ start:51462 stop:54326 length:2865 start_codon:yes stop_codon:yes gene_type:complete